MSPVGRALVPGSAGTLGDFKQLEPVLDVWTGDYKGSSALHHLPHLLERLATTTTFVTEDRV